MLSHAKHELGEFMQGWVHAEAKLESSRRVTSRIIIHASPPMNSMMPSKQIILALAAGTFAVVFAIAGTALPEMSSYKVPLSNDISLEVYVGLFKTKTVYPPQLGTPTDVAKRECGDPPAAPDTGCFKALKSKCYATQAFIIIGVLASTSALVLTILPVPRFIAVVCAFVAAFSYLLVWGIYVHLGTTDPSTGANCGVKTDTTKIGTSLILIIFAWLLAVAQGIVLLLSSKYSAYSVV
eukprot:m.668121 g.668121  ORF g.668121 m.668121 type:complete len:238 (+) comp22754_c0_seq3:763-1476(+)